MVLKLAFVLDLTFYYLSQFVICQKVHAYFSSTRKKIFFYLCRSSLISSFWRNFEIYSIVKQLRFVHRHDLIWMEKTNRKLGIRRIAKLRIGFQSKREFICFAGNIFHRKIFSIVFDGKFFPPFLMENIFHHFSVGNSL